MPEQALSGTFLRLRGRHCLILSIGGTIWAVVAIVAGGLLNISGGIILLIAALLIAIALIASSLYVFREARHAPTTNEPSRFAQMRRLYWTVFRFQYVLILVAVIISFSSTPVYHSLLIIIALINGLHFIALGPILRAPGYVKGVILSLIAIATWFTPTFVTVGGTPSISLFLWFIIPGLGTAIVLWSDAIPSAFGAIRQLRQQPSVSATHAH